MRALQVAVVVILAILCSYQAASCLTLDENEFSAAVTGVSSSSNGLYTWTYEITNTSSNPAFTMWFIGIQIDLSTQVVEIISPGGWLADNSQPDFIAWTYLTGELAQGESASGFEVTYSSQPTEQSWLAQFMDYSSGDLKWVESPLLQTPEPGSVIALLAGLVPFGALLARRRK